MGQHACAADTVLLQAEVAAMVDARLRSSRRVCACRRFLNNTVARYGERYGGGGALWLFMMQRGATAEINATVCCPVLFACLCPGAMPVS